MNLELPAAATEFGHAALNAFAAAGGVELARQAELDPTTRQSLVDPVLARLGVSDLDPTADTESLAAAAELCRVAGYFVLPYPVSAVVLGDRDDPLPFAVVAPDAPFLHHGDLFSRWRVASIDGRTWLVDRPAVVPDSLITPFVATAPLTLEGPDRTAPSATTVALGLALSAWQVLGTLEHALELTVEHVQTRQQFGQPLARFQAVQFQIADAIVAVSGLRELAQYTVSGRDLSMQVLDSLALRVHALEVANQVLRTSHQLHGAIGFCDEHD
ncbi:MAG TPA: acyl-CoA dehydrogenase family protein, partial [Acidimicrobiales bacterium]|nr:acyl-CoA dehydrogenase family protein [Acidimicrobiales bacterium]